MTARYLTGALVMAGILLATTLSTAAAEKKQWTHCADENQRCEFAGTKKVRYGIDGKYVVKEFTNGTACTNDVFGDPATGVVKHCEVLGAGSGAKKRANGDWEQCAEEGQRCAFDGTREVRYGANDTYVTKSFTGGVDCTNGVFGDPVVGVVKHCEVVGDATAKKKDKWTKCADENQRCAFSGTRVVRYGADGKFARKKLTGGVDCNNGVFGDPIAGVVKHCELLNEKRTE